MWLVELGCFPESDDRQLLDTLRRQGIPHHTFRGHEFRSEPALLDSANVPRGSCWFVLQAAERSNWRAGLWGRPGDFDCSRYYPRYGAALLNEGGRFTTVAEFCWNSATFFDEFADDQNRVFVRPDSGFQPFKGRLVADAELADWCEARAKTYVPSDTRILVAPPRKILSEWRCVVVDGRVVAGGAYGASYDSGAAAEAIEFVEYAVRSANDAYRAGAVDVALTGNGFRIVEVGCVLCCSWYDAPYVPIVRALNVIAKSASTFTIL